MTGTGITATHGIITITGARSITDIIRTTGIMTCTTGYRVESMQRLILRIPSHTGTQA
jgi:hypothetical protein